MLDVGCGSVGLATLGVPGRVTGVDRGDRPDYPGERFVQADARELPFADGEFAIAYSNSLIEHLPPADRGRGRRPRWRAWAGACSCRRPTAGSRSSRTRCCRFVHWLPRRSGRRLWKLGVTGEPFDDIHLLDARELRRLFPEARIVRERVAADEVADRGARTDR